MTTSFGFLVRVRVPLFQHCVPSTESVGEAGSFRQERKERRGLSGTVARTVAPVLGIAAAVVAADRALEAIGHGHAHPVTGGFGAIDGVQTLATGGWNPAGARLALFDALGLARAVSVAIADVLTRSADPITAIGANVAIGHGQAHPVLDGLGARDRPQIVATGNEYPAGATQAFRYALRLVTAIRFTVADVLPGTTLPVAAINANEAVHLARAATTAEGFAADNLVQIIAASRRGVGITTTLTFVETFRAVGTVIRAIADVFSQPTDTIAAIGAANDPRRRPAAPVRPDFGTAHTLQTIATGRQPRPCWSLAALLDALGLDVSIVEDVIVKVGIGIRVSIRPIWKARQPHSAVARVTDAERPSGTHFAYSMP